MAISRTWMIGDWLRVMSISQNPVVANSSFAPNLIQHRVSLGRFLSAIVVAVLVLILLTQLRAYGADTDERRWASVLTAAHHKWKSGDYTGAEIDYKEAFQQAKQLGQQYMDLTAPDLASTLESLGKARESEDILRSMLESENGPLWSGSLAALLDREGKLDPELYKKSKYLDFELVDKSRRIYMGNFQRAMARSWMRAMTSASRVNAVERASHQCVLDIQIVPTGIGIVFIHQSSGLARNDERALKAVHNFKVPAYPTDGPPWIMVRFTFSSGTGQTREELQKQDAHETWSRGVALLTWQENNLGKLHPQIPVTVTSIGNTLKEIGERDKAEKVYRTALQIWSELKIDCMNRAFAADSLASLLERKHNYGEAASLRIGAIETLEKRWANTSPWFKSRLQLVADDLDRAQRGSEATVYREKLRNCFGEDDDAVKSRKSLQ